MLGYGQSIRYRQKLFCLLDDDLDAFIFSFVLLLCNEKPGKTGSKTDGFFYENGKERTDATLTDRFSCKNFYAFM